MKLFKKTKDNDIAWRKAEKEDIETVKKIRNSIKCGDVSLVKKMIEEDKQLVRLTTVFGTFLHDAADVGNVEIVKVLIKNGAVFDYSDILRNPMFKAIHGGHLEIVKCLVDSGFDLSIVYNTQSFGKINAYNYAKSYRKHEISDYLEKVYSEKNIELNVQKRDPWVCTVHDDFTGEPFTSKRMKILEDELEIVIPDYFKSFLLDEFPEEMFFEKALDNDQWKWLGLDSGLFHTLRSFIAYNSTEPGEKKKKLIYNEHLAIGTNGGGDFFCIKLGTEEDKVYLYEHESDEYTDLKRTINEHSRWLIENHWGHD